MRIISALIWAYVAGCLGYIITSLIMIKFEMDMFIPIAKDSLLWGKYLVEAFQTKTFFSNTPLLVATILAVISFGSNLNKNRRDRG